MTQPSLEGQGGIAHFSRGGDFPAAPMLFGGVIATFIVVATLLGLDDGRNISIPRSMPVSEVASVTPEAADLGHQGRSGQLAIAVTDVTAYLVAGDPGLPENAQGGHVLVGVRVINDGTDRQRFEPAIQQLVAGDQTVDADQNASQPVLGADIDPGNSIVASIAFNLPEGAEPSAIILRDSPAAPGTQLSLADMGNSGLAQ
ncbi:DUF4352 domain-containing protein [Mycobacteroides chelonae]|uniref:DUF4352 domain-containing protein n=1 Tax=Mycobacteroides chelonae TaxID=1774 RepID=UPI0007A0E5A7|nr:DUF4352 domain-containing protein [Mycobacteroides chelonae]AMW21546.1 hypothetical protein Chelonae_p3795 [Mycobacterium sp. QIA-37]MBF9523195.1 DUF4352 domain-containing protein [Mycobacteroides chelonae]OHU14990.1 hypothetical protein BKG75_07360 [Mycobacteroides chelonae]OHU41597.1 hypothetical protein BKG78_07935 [Mycobacteroides chelonae]